MERIYLYVPPEEYAEVKASGARWDNVSKRWYTEGDPVSPALARWLGDEADADVEPEFVVTSDEAFVASARIACASCRERIEVICLYCESGTDNEMSEPLAQVTLSNIWAMDAALAAQLEPWPFFKNAAGADSDAGYFANHCPQCGAVQEDYLLHSEPGEVFFCIPRAEPGSLTLTPLVGTIRVSGDIGFGV
jgi:hypothetical protein